MSIFPKKIGIDLGTSAVLTYVKGEEVVYNEPPLTAQGRERTLRQVITKAQGRPRLFKPEVAVSVPSAQTSAERRAVAAAAIAAGARQAWLIDEPLAAALGAGLPVGEKRPSAICVIGATTTEVAVIAEWSTIVERSIPVGGRQIDAAIARWLRSVRGVDVDEAEAERLKIEIGAATRLENPARTEVRGVEVTSNDVAEAIAAPLRQIAATIRDALKQAPADVIGRGIVLSGGGAQLRDLDRYISREAGIPATVADQPQTAVVRGAGLALEDFEVVKRNHNLR